MRPKIVAGVVFAGALTLPVVTGAAEPSPSQPTDKPTTPGASAGTRSSAFQMFDIDKDGFISRAEARNSADLSARFNEIDTDRDGKISAEEFNAGSRVRGTGSAQKK
jgi:hypothetical protein